MPPTTPFRDVSAPGTLEAPGRPPRPGEAWMPASDEHPLLAANGGVLTIDRLGTVAYTPAWELQEELAEQRRARRIGDRLLLLEHFPVYTLGRGGDESNLLASAARLREIGAEFVRIDRGGDITFHGPGQLVAYPIVELRDPLDLRRYVRILESAIIATVAALGVEADRVDGSAGVWVDGERKLAAIGVRVEVGAFGPWEANAYLVWDGRSADALVVDPGMGAAAALVERVRANGLRLHLIANSHGHIDHIFDNAALVRASSALLAIHADDADRLSGANVYGFSVEPSEATRVLREGE